MCLSFYASTASDYGSHQAAMAQYLADGTRRALALPNRGPIRYEHAGNLHEDILAAYAEYGFYIFTGVVGEEERADLQRDVEHIWDNAPVTKRATVDRHGRPALAADCEAPVLSWVRPLSDPLGGTSFSHGRHPAKMIEPEAPADAPEHVLQLVLGSLQFSDAALRLYGHPGSAARGGGHQWR